jgi:hypothetical protein
LDEGEPLLKMPSVGGNSINELIKLGLVEVAPRISLGKQCYRLTKTGNNMHEELSRLKLIPTLWRPLAVVSDVAPGEPRMLTASSVRKRLF